MTGDVLVVRSRIASCTEVAEAPAWQGAKREHIGNMRAMSNAARRDASATGCRGNSRSGHKVRGSTFVVRVRRSGFGVRRSRFVVRRPGSAADASVSWRNDQWLLIAKDDGRID